MACVFACLKLDELLDTLTCVVKNRRDKEEGEGGLLYPGKVRDQGGG